MTNKQQAAQPQSPNLEDTTVDEILLPICDGADRLERLHLANAAKLQINQLITNRVIEAEIKLLSYILVYGATGHKVIGLKRDFIVSLLAEKQQTRKDLWESKPKG